MAVITNYATLQTAVGDYLARSDLSGFIPNFIQNAENKLYRRFNIRDMETALSGTVSSGSLALPTRFNALKYAYVNTTVVVPLQVVSLETLYENYPDRGNASSCPVMIAESAGSFIFGPSASAIDIAGVYYQRYEPLRTTDPNWYVTNAPEVLLYGALLEAEPFIMNDARIPVWQAGLQDAMDSIMRSERESKYSGSSPRQRVA